MKLCEIKTGKQLQEVWEIWRARLIKLKACESVRGNELYKKAVFQYHIQILTIATNVRLAELSINNL